MTSEFVRYLGQFYLIAQDRYGPASAEIDEVADIIFVVMCNDGQLTRVKWERLIKLCGVPGKQEVANAGK